MDERFRRALRRNALLNDVLAEGYLPSADSALRGFLRARLPRGRLWIAVAAAIALLALAPLLRRPAPAPALPAPLLEVVRTGSLPSSLQIVPTGAPEMEIVGTSVSNFALELLEDEALLRDRRVVAIVGHPGGPRRLVVRP